MHQNAKKIKLRHGHVNCSALIFIKFDIQLYIYKAKVEDKMKNRKYFFGLIILVMVLGITATACENGLFGPVPLWARGTWYTTSSGPLRTIACEITATQYISYNLLTGAEIERFNYTSKSGDTVNFGARQVKRLGSSNQISSGVPPLGATTYYK